MIYCIGHYEATLNDESGMAACRSIRGRAAVQVRADAQTAIADAFREGVV